MTTDLGEYGSGEEPVSAEPDQPRQSPRLTRRHLVAVPLVLLLVESVFLGERIHAQHGRDADPVRVATAFFDAVQTDHAAAAAELTRLPTDVDTRFTQTDLTAQGGIARPTVTTVVRRGDRATVTVAYTVAGFAVHSDVVLARTYTGLLHDPTWRIVGGLPVVHVRAAPFETTAFVNDRRVVLRQGSADVTVLPGLVQVRLAALPPAGSSVQTVSATGKGALARFPATLDVELEFQLYTTITEATNAQDPAAGLDFSGTPDLDVRLSDDASRVTFNGRLTGPTRYDPATGEPVSAPGPAVSGSATFADGQFTVTALHID